MICPERHLDKQVFTDYNCVVYVLRWLVVLLLNVNEVKRNSGTSQSYNWQETVATLNLAHNQLQEDIWLDAPLEINLVVRHGGDRLLVEGQIQAVLRMVCGRCLAEFQSELVFPIEEQYLFSAKNQQVDKRYDRRTDNEEDEDADQDFQVLEGDTIDGSAVVLEALIPALPMKPLCREDCLGLCPICGKDLNHETCNCTEDLIDPRLAGLAGWLDKK